MRKQISSRVWRWSCLVSAELRLLQEEAAIAEKTSDKFTLQVKQTESAPAKLWGESLNAQSQIWLALMLPRDLNSWRQTLLINTAEGFGRDSMFWCWGLGSCVQQGFHGCIRDLESLNRTKCHIHISKV